MSSKHENIIYTANSHCVKNGIVLGLSDSIRAAKFPMSVRTDLLNDELTEGIENLAKCQSGTGHDQWLTGVVVQFDLTFTNKAWVEAERYHFLDFVSSQSTMHRITKFDLDQCYCEYVDPDIIAIMKSKVKAYNELCDRLDSQDTIDPEDRELQARRYLEILYSNPCGFQLTARMTTNYRQLKTIYLQRRHHKLPDWQDFCDWIAQLPQSYLITGE